MRLPLLLLAAGFLLPAASSLRAADSFDVWAEELARRFVRLNPQLATRTQYLAAEEQDALDRDLALSGMYGESYGAAQAKRLADFARAAMGELARFPEAGLTPTQRTTAAIIRWRLDRQITGEVFARNTFVFEQFGGLHLGLVHFLTATHPLRHRRDAENYLARLAVLSARLDEAIAEARDAAAAGVLPPRFVLERVLGQLDNLLAGQASDHPLVAGFAQRLEALGGALSVEVRARFRAQAENTVQDAVLPAFQRVQALLREQLARATDDAGIWRLPRGDASYAWALETLTTTALRPEEIHAVGLREVARISAEMEGILIKLGYAGGTIDARLEQLNAKLNPPAVPDPRPQLLDKVAAVVRDAERRARASFDLLPRAPVEVRREPAFSEGSAAAHYSDPAPDGSLPGIYWIPLKDLGPRVTWLGVGLKSTAYHEAIPGHHFQVAIQQEADLPRCRKLGVFGENSAYIEGWALYAERLADENGWYEDDLPGRLGYLNMQLFRAKRLVVDTGLHSKRWTRQQVIDYGFTPAETERYIVWPGQACSYMIGQLRLLELREKARAALGAKFSIQAFHNEVLRGGSMPLEVLARELDAWVATVLSRN
ncbi:MAG: DUF885 domain-containing protein [Verrucomicrobia bacterium]|nr:DUF885 domain-containing protein [Verrucomicrobiota bacterium]